ncbi:DNA methyltransferase [Hymenobacter sp. DG01]|uniref:DNA-methyltransferase n=1 Tax=Hymenobacter sp. DG01 TaxID=2584940 RepID=UPI001122DB23|nr:DNA methyltransferase [Hymenobacter sp. DG01]
MDNLSSDRAKAPKARAPRNQTLTVEPAEESSLMAKTITVEMPTTVEALQGKVIHQDLFKCLPNLPARFIDLLIIDPPYNLSKKFGKSKFAKTSTQSYGEYVESWLLPLLRCLKPAASIYVCCDWPSSSPIQQVLEKHLIIRNRITWEREKGRGAKTNWKNCSEDIWFCTLSEDYYFNVEAVKLKRKVIAPYRDAAGDPKDWEENNSGNYRLTHPSNLWTDISIPFWSMPENTDHPTQKPEKLVAKLLLASSRPGDFVFDPFLGSGTTAVVAKKLGRNFAGVELEPEYCQMAVKRLEATKFEDSIQGYHDGYFWERNSLAEQKNSNNPDKTIQSPLEIEPRKNKRGRPKKQQLEIHNLFNE